MKTYIILFFCLISLATSCRQDDDPVDAQKPVIKMVSPTNHDTISRGDTIHYLINVTDNESLRRVLFTLELIDGTSLLEINRELKGDSRAYTIDTVYYIADEGFAQINHHIEATDKNNNTAKLDGHIHERH